MRSGNGEEQTEDGIASIAREFPLQDRPPIEKHPRRHSVPRQPNGCSAPTLRRRCCPFIERCGARRVDVYNRVVSRSRRDVPTEIGIVAG